MSYFQTHAHQLRFPLISKSKPRGLRNNQLGALTATIAHFTLSNDRALVSMPTGSGKTAVIMALCYALRAHKVLVVTPSALVRNQIAEGFKTLGVLKDTGVLPKKLPSPDVKEVENLLSTQALWEEAMVADVVVGTPNSISPAMPGVILPEAAAFDLVLVDEAHHSAAATWEELLNAFPQARQVLFTATPFRNDQKALEAKIIYHYPLEKAHEDGIFGNIQFFAVPSEDGQDMDRLIAQKAAELFKTDQEAGLDHRLMVRVDQKSRATALKAIYDETPLKLEVVHSQYAMSTIKKRIEALKAGTLDGIICVDMLGEGFDLPQLKIAAVHSPHKSLAVTLQFIGRFARPGSKTGIAKFVAAESEYEVEGAKLFNQDAAWSTIIQDLSEHRVRNVLQDQEFYNTFKAAQRTEVAFDLNGKLSLSSFSPYCHVKVYRIHGDVNLHAHLDGSSFPTRYHSTSESFNTTVSVWQNTEIPKWTENPLIRDAANHLLVAHFDPDSRFFFITTTSRLTETYDLIMEKFLTEGSFAEPLSLPILRRAIAGWQNARFFNVGMRSRKAMMGEESYRIITGSSADRVLGASDQQTYVGGHSFGSGVDVNGEEVLLGLSTSSKVWSHQYLGVRELVAWSDDLAAKLNNPDLDALHNPLSVLDAGFIVQELAPNLRHPIAVDWDHTVYLQDKKVVFQGPGEDVTCAMLNLDLKVTAFTSTSIDFEVSCETASAQYRFSLQPYAHIRPLEDNPWTVHLLSNRKTTGTLIQYLNAHPPVFYFDDFSMLRGPVLHIWDSEGSVFDSSKLLPEDWAAANVNIQREFGVCLPKISIHDHLRNVLLPRYEFVFYDHSRGEMADFVCGHMEENRLVLSLYHCKGAGGKKEGDRVDDLYEVCGQAVKSLQWAEKKRLNHKIKQRLQGQRAKHLKGNLEDFKARIQDHPMACVNLRVYIVQPGVNSQNLTQKMQSLLAAAHKYLRETHVGEADLFVVCS